LKVYDPQVSLGNLCGTNRDFIERVIPHLGHLLTQDMGELVAHAEVIVIGSKIQGLPTLGNLIREDQILIDLVRAFPENRGIKGIFQGISW
jgi:GDP-mannose 6-dehydrogenase